MMTYALLLLTTLLMCSMPAFAANNTTSATFLKIGAGARAAGMGDAFCSMADDVYAYYWNPAGLAYVKGSQFGATHLEWLTGINQEQVGFVQQIGSKTGLGININYLMANEFDRTNEGGIIGTFDAANSLFGLSLGRQLSNRFSLGLNMKCINMSMDDAKAIAYGGDIGMLWRISRGLRFGLNVQNIGSDVQFIEKAYPLPLNIKAGISYSLGGMNLAVDVNKTRGFDSNVHAGCEYWLARTLALRLGIKNEVTSNTHGKSSGMATGVTAGMGLKLGGIQLDYAYAPYGLLDVTHRVSLSVKRMPHVPSSPEAPQPGTKTLPEVAPQVQVEPGTKTTVGSATIAAEVKPEHEQKIEEKPAIQQKGGSTSGGGSTYSNERIVLPSFDIRFDTGRAMITQELCNQLNALVEFMNCHPQIRIRIEGHTDNRAIDTAAFPSNQELSDSRAKTIYWYLAQQWIQAERMETKGYADSKPIAANDTPEGQAKNRRVEIFIIGQEGGQ
ncbi:PorV/PorQ family protein [Candidatus Desantisbacteria bacterium]|nr:PorV/PorQ family protein [Candidatus Desantisbacteria bacterium]